MDGAGIGVAGEQGSEAARKTYPGDPDQPQKAPDYEEQSSRRFIFPILFSLRILLKL